MRKHFLFLIFFYRLILGSVWYGDSVAFEKLNSDISQLNYEYFLTVNNLSDAELKVKKTLLVQNERGLANANLILLEDKFSKVKELSGKIMDPDLSIIKKIKKKDFVKTNISSVVELVTDVNKYIYMPDVIKFPCIIEYEYKINLNSLFVKNNVILRSFLPRKIVHVVLDVPKDLHFRYHCDMLEESPRISQGHNGRIRFEWTLKNVLPFPEHESNAPPEYFQKFLLYFSPGSTVMGKNLIGMNSWKEFANWLIPYYWDDSTLPPEVKDVIDSLKRISSSPVSFISNWYHFAVRETRYLAFNVGMLGWIPFTCDRIWYNKYGDCKNLTHFIVQGLRYAGYDAYPALALTRDEGVVKKDFVCNQFNHMIGVVFLENDTIFLENTSDVFAAGQLGWTDEGMNVLVLKKDTVEFLKTPESLPEDNLWFESVDAYVDKMGNIHIEGTAKITGNYSMSFRQDHAFDNQDEIRRSIFRMFGRRFPTIQNFEIRVQNMNDHFEKPLRFFYSFDVVGYVVKRYPRLFIRLSMLTSKKKSSLPKKKRETPVFFYYRNLVVDSIRFHLPEGYEVEAMPKSIQMDYPFGKYEYTVHKEGNQVIFTRKYSIKERIIPVNQYKDYRKFIRQIIKQDRKKLVLIRSKGVL
jgi:hypothetical protein